MNRLSELGSRVNPDDDFFSTTRLNTVGTQDDELRQLLEKITARSPNDVNRLGMSYWRNQQFDSALATFEELVKVWPNSASAWANLGVAYGSVSRSDDVRKAFEKSRELDPLNDTASEAYEWFRSQQAAPGPTNN